MKIEVDLSKLSTHNISANDYIFLYLHLLGKEIPSIISDNVNFAFLEEQGYIKVIDDGFVKRPKATALFATAMETNSVEEWIDEWRNIWPSGVKSGGKPVRGSKSDCVRKMKAFLRRTDYTKQDVFNAAEAYVRERAKSNYTYMITANYFIQKDSESSLESWCETMAEDGDRAKEFGEFHKEV